mmetsp:Transcript_24569/g.57243  ORF Transcript_24569/g.57243 Transcript_24569/m.57243 type:complete len:114 (+) Transcript_24569:1291-1632(+)
MPRLRFLLLNDNEGLIQDVPLSVQSMSLLEVVTLQGTSFQGNLDAMCSTTRQSLVVVADCDEISCPCCALCCAGSVGCPDASLLSPFDPTWETRFERTVYQFRGVVALDVIAS